MSLVERDRQVIWHPYTQMKSAPPPLGVVRGDLFWGTGEAALEEAGRMKQPGQYYLLLPRAIAKRVARAD